MGKIVEITMAKEFWEIAPTDIHGDTDADTSS